ncbi:MAG: hypothetical protein KDN05_21295, partial [Verrucomicrobiae bacterium]|nr:hypothetical protein [Verrucomicrobiae bacterium]
LAAYFRNSQRLKEYLDEFYDEPHSIRNHWSFTMASEHIARHFSTYEAEGLGESGDGEFFLSEGLERAIHWYFAVLPREDWRHDDDSVGRILMWAREWKRANPGK